MTRMPRSEQSIEGSVSPEILARIQGRELLIQHLGYWPSFHDFEVIFISLERAPWLATATCDLRAKFYVYDLQEAPNSPERKQALAELLFEQIDDLKIEGFNHQNPIIGLSILKRTSSHPEPAFFVAWGGTCLRHEVSFSCNRISILRVTDLNPFRKPIQTP